MKNKVGSNKGYSSVNNELLEHSELKKELEATFKMAAKDEELTRMAEEGLGDYLKHLKQLEYFLNLWL